MALTHHPPHDMSSYKNMSSLLLHGDGSANDKMMTSRSALARQGQSPPWVFSYNKSYRLQQHWAVRMAILRSLVGASGQNRADDRTTEPGYALHWCSTSNTRPAPFKYGYIVPVDPVQRPLHWRSNFTATKRGERKKKGRASRNAEQT